MGWELRLERFRGRRVRRQRMLRDRKLAREQRNADYISRRVDDAAGDQADLDRRPALAHVQGVETDLAHFLKLLPKHVNFPAPVRREERVNAVAFDFLGGVS